MEPPTRPDALPLAAELLLDFLRRRDEGEALDFEAFCDEHTALAPELRRLQARYEALARTGGPTPNTDDDVERDAELLLASLGETVAQRYAVKREIARGGMGVILEVTDRPLRRIVAMKVLHGAASEGAATPSRSVHPRVLARFLAEAQVTGQLEHPGIVPVHDLGIGEDGRVFYTMPLVRGLDLQAVIQRARSGLDGWSVPRVVGVLVRVCEAIAYAHDKGAVHRDLKPSNIMVGRFGETYVLDWGLAHVIGNTSDARPTLDTVRHDVDAAPAWHTLEGSIVGTPAYMAPEQANLQGEPVDARTDVYAIGAVLYELLTGDMPYTSGDEQPTTGQVLARVREGPPRAIAEVARDVPQELVSICERAMARDRNDRYPDALALRDDLRAFLEGRVVRAYETGALAELRKWMRRNRALATALSGLAIALVVGAVVVAWQASRVATESTTRREVGGFLREMLTSIDPVRTAGKALTVREMLDDAALRIGDRFEDAPLVRAEIHDAVGSTYYLLGAFHAAEQQLRAAVHDYEVSAGRAANDTLIAKASLALTLRQLGELEEAEALLLEAQEQLSSPEGTAAQRVRGHLAIVLEELGRYDEALPLYRENYERASSELGPDDAVTLLAQSNMGAVLMNLRRFDEALPIVEDCHRRYGARFGKDAPDTIMVQANLAGLLSATGERELGASMLREAIERSERVLGPEHLSTMRRRLQLVLMEFRLGNADGALELARAELDACERILGPTHADTIAALELTVAILGFGDEMEAAEKLALDAHRRAEEALGPEHRVTGRVAHLVEQLYDQWGKPEETANWRARVEASSFRTSRGKEADR